MPHWWWIPCEIPHPLCPHPFCQRGGVTNEHQGLKPVYSTSATWTVTVTMPGIYIPCKLTNPGFCLCSSVGPVRRLADRALVRGDRWVDSRPWRDHLIPNPGLYGRGLLVSTPDGVMITSLSVWLIWPHVCTAITAAYHCVQPFK